VGGGRKREDIERTGVPKVANDKRMTYCYLRYLSIRNEILTGKIS